MITGTAVENEIIKEFSILACLLFLGAVEFSSLVPALLQSTSSLQLHITHSEKAGNIKTDKEYVCKAHSIELSKTLSHVPAVFT